MDMQFELIIKTPDIFTHKLDRRPAERRLAMVTKRPNSFLRGADHFTVGSCGACSEWASLVTGRRPLTHLWRIRHHVTVEGADSGPSQLQLTYQKRRRCRKVHLSRSRVRNVDLGGDKILPGAFSLYPSQGRRLSLYFGQHNPSDPIGSVKVTDTSQGLQVEGQLLLADPTAAKAYQFSRPASSKVSLIGYETVKASFVDDVPNLDSSKLWEFSS